MHYPLYNLFPQEGDNFQLLLVDLVLTSSPVHQSDESSQKKKGVVKELSPVAFHCDAL